MTSPGEIPGEIRALGYDPGLANTGCAAIRRLPDGSYANAGLVYLHTEAATDKSHKHTRQSVDDDRRVRDQWKAIEGQIDAFQPHVIGVETYSIYEPRDAEAIREAAQALAQLLGAPAPFQPAVFGEWLSRSENGQRVADAMAILAQALRMKATTAGRGQAAKTLLVYQAILDIGHVRGIPVYPFLPADRTRLVTTSRRKVSKEEVAEYLYARVAGLEDAALKLAKSNRGHCTDGAAHALLAAEAYVRDVGAFGAAARGVIAQTA